MSRLRIFDVPRKPEHLRSANDGVANARYRQVSASKDVTGSQFSSGVQQFRFDTSGTTWFLPSMCYFRLRCSLHQVREDGGTPLPILANADLAPNMGLAANLFKSVELRLNGHTVERVSERLPQIDALKTRMGNTGAWLHQVGKTTNFWGADFATRRARVAVDGYEAPSDTGMPVYGPWLTQAEAGFHANHRTRFHPGRGIFSCDENGAGTIDIQKGPMSLRPGDRLRHGECVLLVQHLIDRKRGLATIVETGRTGYQHIEAAAAGGAGGAPEHKEREGVSGWTIQKRQASPGNTALGKNQFEIVWRPPLGFFEVDHAIPPGGQWLLEFNPANAQDCQKNAVESMLGDLDILRPPTEAGQFEFKVDEFQLYLYVMEAERFDRGTWYLDLQQSRCQLQSMPADCTSLVQKNFDVPGKTTHLTLAFQDQAEGSDTRYSKSKFKIRPSEDDEKGSGCIEGQDLLLERFFIHYGQEQKPTPDFDGRYDDRVGDTTVPQTNYLVHRYADTLMQANLYHTEGGAESFEHWLQRGPYYHFRWPKDATENSTRASVNFKFARPFAGGMQHQVMLFSQWRSAYKIVHRDGRIEVQGLPEM